MSSKITYIINNKLAFDKIRNFLLYIYIYIKLNLNNINSFHIFFLTIIWIYLDFFEYYPL